MKNADPWRLQGPCGDVSGRARRLRLRSAAVAAASGDPLVTDRHRRRNPRRGTGFLISRSLSTIFKEFFPHDDKVSPGGVLTAEAQDLLRYPYPGNVRELKHIIEHASVMSQGETHNPRDASRGSCPRIPTAGGH